MRKVIGIYTIFMAIGLFLKSEPGMAAPPPSEVEARKNEAPLHLIGSVTKDEYFKDLSLDKQHPQQIRKMSLKVDRLYRGPENIKKSIEVFYWYIPSWQSKEYTGGRRMDIAAGDVIEIWLTPGKYGLEPALGGHTVKHIYYAEARKEAIPEPFVNSIERKLSSLAEYNEVLVLIILSLILVLIFIKAGKLTK